MKTKHSEVSTESNRSTKCVGVANKKTSTDALYKSELRFEAKVYANGKSTLPIELKRILEVRDGDSLIYIKKGDDFIITTRAHLLAQGRKYFKSCTGTFTVDDFIAERRKDSAAIETPCKQC